MSSENTSSWQKFTTKRLCDECKKGIAVWIYMPTDKVCCDKCVPRGCSCNVDLKEGIDPIFSDAGMIINSADDYEEKLGPKGEKLPCCEWEYVENGFLLEDNPQTVLLRKFVDSTNSCPSCTTQLTGYSSPMQYQYKLCPKCGWSTKEIDG